VSAVIATLRKRIGLRTRFRRSIAWVRRPRRLDAERTALVERTLDGMRDYNAIMCESAPNGRLLELGGVVAAVIPDTPENSVMNAVVYDRVEALAAALDELASAYDRAGVEAWMVWVPVVDREARRLLKRAGHRLEANPTAMARDLHGIERPARGVLEEWTAHGDLAEMVAILDRAFLFGTAFARTFPRRPPDRARVYMASLDGKPVSCILTSDHDGNCAVDLVATLPEARGRGLAGALLLNALTDAAERGCRTTTLIAVPEGQPLYARLGYRAVCPLQQWERRRES
jgi:GNAT superfamily N-acetyltransferase